jgi:aryl-alcohol dehydrogenase-like predicted oxidoreductase
VKYRYLGNSGFKVSELTYGNWLTHSNQVDDAVAIATVHAALDGGITSFDTADVYANTEAEVVLGKALAGQRRESLEIFTKTYWPIGPRGANDTGLSRKHIMDSINGSLRRLQTDYVDLYQAHRFDYETPLEETMQAFADIVRQGKALYIGVSEWNAQQISLAHEMSKQLGFQLISNQPQYSMLWRVIEAEIVPTSEALGVSQIVWSPMAQGVLTGKYLPGQPVPADSRAANDKANMFIKEMMDDALLTAVQQLKPIADDLGLTLAQLALAWTLQNPNVSSAIVGASRPDQITSNLGAVGVEIPAEVMDKIEALTKPFAKFDPALTESPATRI